MPHMGKLNGHETKADFARRVGLSRGRISQLIAKGLPTTPEGKIDPEAGLAWLEDNLDADRPLRGRRSALRRHR